MNEQNKRTDEQSRKTRLGELLPGLEEGGEAKVGAEDRRVLGLGLEEEVLGLEVAVHHAHVVAVRDDADDRADEPGRVLLRVVLLLDDRVEELAALCVLGGGGRGGGR
jgi:hypothetical protein